MEEFLVQLAPWRNTIICSSRDLPPNRLDLGPPCVNVKCVSRYGSFKEYATNMLWRNGAIPESDQSQKVMANEG